MAQNIPDELLRDILKYALWPIPLQEYLQESEVVLEEDLGGPRTMPSSDVLLVCKRWLRVATPLYYEYVKVSTTEQMQRLAAVLRANPDIGPMIRHLRLLGGYGRDLDTVSKHTTRVETLAISHDLKSKDSNVGLLRALPRLNPTRLFLSDARMWAHRSNKKTQAADTAIVKAITSWPSLEQLYLSRFMLSTEFTKALSDTPTLRVLSVDSNALLPLIRSDHSCFSDATAETLVIHCRAREPSTDNPNATLSQAIPPHIKKRIVYKLTRTVLKAEEEMRVLRARWQAISSMTTPSSLSGIAKLLGIWNDESDDEDQFGMYDDQFDEDDDEFPW